MLLLRDVIYNDALFEVNVIYNHPCVCFRESRSSLNFNLSWVSQLFVVIQRQPRVWGLGGLGRGRLVVWNPRIPRESQNSKVTTGPQTIWVTIAPTKQKHPEFRIRSPEVDFCLQNSTSGIFWHPWLWGGDELKMYGQLIILNEYVGGRNQVAGRKTSTSTSLCSKMWENTWKTTCFTKLLAVFFQEGIQKWWKNTNHHIAAMVFFLVPVTHVLKTHSWFGSKTWSFSSQELLFHLRRASPQTSARPS